MPTSTLSLPPACFFLGGDEVVELVAGGEPFLAAAEEDVVDRQLAGVGSCRTAWILQADAAALEGDERFFERGQRADEAWSSASPSMRRPSSGSKTASARPCSSSCVLHFLFGLHVVGVRFCLRRGTAAAGRRRRARLRPARTSGDRRT